MTTYLILRKQHVIHTHRVEADSEDQARRMYAANLADYVRADCQADHGSIEVKEETEAHT